MTIFRTFFRITPVLFLRSLIFTVLSSIAAAVFFMLTPILFPASLKFRYTVLMGWCRFTIFIARWICGIRYHIKGKENIPAKGACIVISKHQSTWETLLYPQLFPHQSWILKKELLNIPFFGWGLRALKPIAINRKDKYAFKAFIEQASEKLKSGMWVVVYPEGTRAPPGTEVKFTRTGAMLATESGFPVLPVAVNSGNSWPKRFIKTPGLITVSIGPCITETAEMNSKALNNQVEAWIKEEMTEINGED